MQLDACGRWKRCRFQRLSGKCVKALDVENHWVPGSRSEEEQARAMLYGVLARLLSFSPDQAVLDLLSKADVADGNIGQCIGLLKQAAIVATPQAVEEEYHNLFIGLGRGELVPYASYYLTGFLHEKPLAKLRADMAVIGAVHKAGSSDPEDHAAAVLETMGGLVAGKFGVEQSAVTESSFYRAHVESWMPVFFGDLQKAKSACFYRAVGALGLAFLEIENAQFKMAA